MNLDVLIAITVGLFAVLVLDALRYRRKNRKLRGIRDGKLVNDLLDSGRMK